MVGDAYLVKWSAYTINGWVQGQSSCAMLLLTHHRCGIYDKCRCDPWGKQLETSITDYLWHSERSTKASTM